VSKLSISLSFSFFRKPSTFSFFDLFSPMYLVSIYIFFSAIFSFLCHSSSQLYYIHAFISTRYLFILLFQLGMYSCFISTIHSYFFSTRYFCFYFILHLNFSYLLSVIFVISVLSCLCVVHLVCNFKLCFRSISTIFSSSLFILCFFSVTRFILLIFFSTSLHNKSVHNFIFFLALLLW